MSVAPHSPDPEPAAGVAAKAMEKSARAADMFIGRLLAYRTQRYVVIRDFRLGLLMFSGIAGVIVYILYYVMFYEQSFRKPVAMSGVADLHLCEECQAEMRPGRAYLDSFCWDLAVGRLAVQSWLANFTCGPSDGDESGASDPDSAPQPPVNRARERVPDPAPGKLPCLYQPSDLQTVTFPPNSVFIATERRVGLHWQEEDCVPYDITCPRRTCEVGRYAMPYASYWPLRLLHNIQSSQNYRYNWTNEQLPGMLHFSGVATKLWNGSVHTPQQPPDYFTLGDLLRMADDPADGEHLATSDGQGHWVLTPEARRNGGVLGVTVTYQNNGRNRQWNDDKPEYTVKVHVLSRTFRYNHQTDDLINGQNVHVDSGWIIIVSQEFVMGSFDFVTFLVHIAASLPLLQVLFIGIDLISEFVLPFRQAYNRIRFAYSPDFSELIATGQMRGACCCDPGLTPEIDPLARRMDALEARLGVVQPGHPGGVAEMQPATSASHPR
eukprot:TRINITY_DN70606_c0_g1_i1.p1 TRINITY_DN70606_c0_g1~~TRINITY_DN70606_c0_g1_i1.p1  ORF type:complete len:513 (+),score=123.18 TRINITY_DN70606_c0_g1_i1:60-1541(+)